MDPEIQELKELVQNNLKLSEETNKMVHGMRRSARVGTFFRLLYWILILGSLFAAYQFAFPYLAQLQQIYSKIQTNSPTSSSIQNPLQQYLPKL